MFIGSAWADVGIGVFEACKDLSDNKFESGKIFKVGLQQPDAVRLIMTADTPDTVRQRIASLQKDILAGKIHVEAEFSGPEFQI